MNGPWQSHLLGVDCQGPRSIWFGQNERPKLCARERYRPVKKLTLSPEDFRQLGDVHSNPSRLVPLQQFRRRPSPRLFLEIDIGELLAAGVEYHKASLQFFD